MKYYSIILILFLFSCSYHARVKRVIDGDSFYLTNGNEIRIAYADCPEYSHGHYQNFGDKAKEFTRQLIEGKEVKLIPIDTDKYHRKVCKVILSNGSDLSELLVVAGLAFTYPKYCPVWLSNEEQKAKINHVGLWVQNNPVTPYQFRKTIKKIV